MDRQRLVILLEMAMMAALAVVFSQIKVFEMPQGGSVSLVMVPIALIAVRRGLLAGVVTGMVVGLLQLLFGSTLVNPVQVLLDYPLAFAALGLTGLVRLSGREGKKQRILALWSGLLIGGWVAWFAILRRASSGLASTRQKARLSRCIPLSTTSPTCFPK